MRRKENKDQLTFFDVLNNEPEILYYKGDVLFQQLKGEVVPYTITGENWLCHEGKTRGYRLQQENGCYNVVTNDSTDFYRTQEEAEEAAGEWLIGKDVIPPEQISFTYIEVYQYTRKLEGDHKMTAFLGVMENGDLYIKNFMSYHHVVKDSKKARKGFQEDLERNAKCKIEKIEGYMPEVKRMYRCKAGDTWMYAEARYGGAIG